jgi:hypothetical protein
MKLFGQHGYGDGNKTSEGLQAGYIQGVIFRPRDISAGRLQVRCEELRTEYPKAEIVFDPQCYAGILVSDPSATLGKLEDEEYKEYFGRLILGRLEVETNVVDVMRRALEFQRRLPVTGIIAPNILIRRSLDSREAVISKNFIRQTKKIWSSSSDPRSVYATLAVSRDALVNMTELQDFMNDLTSIEDPPDGFYVLIAARSSEARADIYHADVIAGWMLLNYSLHLNGFRVINGYSDLVSPFLGAVGADVGASGWWSNSRTFSLDQFALAPPGGRLPTQRYLSVRLLNRIRFDEYNAWRRLLPEVVNGLDTDALYQSEGGEPERAREVLQSWQAIQFLNQRMSQGEVAANLEVASRAIEDSIELYTRVESLALRPDPKSNGDHLEPTQDGIGIFRRVAEI